MRAIQLKCFYTGKPAPEADRARIQAKIDSFEALLKKDPESALASSYRFSIMALKGQVRMPRG